MSYSLWLCGVWYTHPMRIQPRNARQAREAPMAKSRKGRIANRRNSVCNRKSPTSPAVPAPIIPFVPTLRPPKQNGPTPSLNLSRVLFYIFFAIIIKSDRLFALILKGGGSIDADRTYNGTTMNTYATSCICAIPYDTADSIWLSFWTSAMVIMASKKLPFPLIIPSCVIKLNLTLFLSYTYCS